GEKQLVNATLAETLLDIKKSIPKDKGKGIMQETELPRKIKKREMIQLKSSKKQKLDEQTEEEVEAQVDTDLEIKEMKLYVKIVPDEDIAIDVIPLATKPLVIVEYKIVKKGEISTYHIIRADGSTKRYTSMVKLLENIDIEDLETFWKLVKDKHGNTRPEEDYERVLWGDIKVMFKPDIESEVWRQLQGYDVTSWKLFSSKVRSEQITFDINERESLAVISPICVINNFSKINETDEPRNLEELLMRDDIDGDLGLARLNDDSSGMFCNPNSNSSISMDDFVKMDDVRDNLDFRDLTNKGTICKEFMEKGLTEVLFRKPFKEHVRIVEDPVKGVLCFKIEDDKMIFNMPHVEERLDKLTVRKHNTMGPFLKSSDEYKSKGIHHPYQKVKGFYQGYLELGGEYKQDQEVIDWIKGHAS
nr:hypothetical protein [Tanacetum cinerariifolium]